MRNSLKIAVITVVASLVPVANAVAAIGDPSQWGVA
jgi:hypothetical protein